MLIFSLLQYIEGFSMYLIISTLSGLKGKISFPGFNAWKYLPHIE